MATDPGYIKEILERFRVTDNLAVLIANRLDGPIIAFGVREPPTRPHIFQVTLRVKVKHVDDPTAPNQSAVTLKVDVGVDYDV